MNTKEIEEIVEEFLISAGLNGKIGEHMLNNILTTIQAKHAEELEKPVVS